MSHGSWQQVELGAEESLMWWHCHVGIFPTQESLCCAASQIYLLRKEHLALGISVSQKLEDLDQSLLNEENVSLLIKGCLHTHKKDPWRQRQGRKPK